MNKFIDYLRYYTFGWILALFFGLVWKIIDRSKGSKSNFSYSELISFARPENKGTTDIAEAIEGRELRDREGKVFIRPKAPTSIN